MPSFVPPGYLPGAPNAEALQMAVAGLVDHAHAAFAQPGFDAVVRHYVTGSQFGGHREQFCGRTLRVRDIEMKDQATRASSQKSSKRPLRRQQRKAMMELAPRTVQNIPERFSRAPMTALQPASITPEPTKSPMARNRG